MVTQHKMTSRTSATMFAEKPADIERQTLPNLYDFFEKEASRIAHRLHDDAAQLLAVVYLELAAIARDAPEETSSRITVVVKLLDDVCCQLRLLSHELRPFVLDQLGLVPALHALVNGVKARSSLHINVTADNGGRLPPDIETVIYRCAQEALTNISRHARASQVDVLLRRKKNSLLFVVSDNGTGFSADDVRHKVNGGLGLTGIRERVNALGGSCDITSSPGLGTTIHITIGLSG